MGRDVVPGAIKSRGTFNSEVRQRIEQRIELNEEENEVLEDIREI